MNTPLWSYHPDDSVALGSPGDRTCGHLMADASRLASALPCASDDDHVLVICRDRYHFAVAIVAAWSAGYAIALPAHEQADSVLEVGRAVGARMLLHDSDGRDGFDVRPLLGDAPLRQFDTPTFPPLRPIVTLFTSGTTGQPVPCRKCAQQLLGEARMLTSTFGIGPSGRVLPTVAPHHIYGLLFGVLLPFAAGAPFVRSTPSHPLDIERGLRDHRATVLATVPAHLRAMTTLSSLSAEVVFSSTAPLPAETAAALGERLRVQVTEVFGSTETGGIAWRRGSTHSWTPLPGVSASCAPDGRLLLHDGFFPPSANRPWLCDDRVEMDHEGGFRILGRSDRIVKIGGKRVSLAECEQRMLSLPGVKDATAVAVPVDSARGTELWAAVVAPGWDARRLRAELARWLDPVALPRRVRFVPFLPRLSNGKLPRQRVLELFQRPNRSKCRFDVVQPPSTQPDTHGQEVVLEVHVPPDLAFFDGHFSQAPMLPGVTQIYPLVLPEVARRWPQLKALRQVRNLKFRAPILPGDVLQLGLSHSAHSPVVHFRIARDGEVCTTGALVFSDLQSDEQE